MAIDVDKSEATKQLNASYMRSVHSPATDCCIRSTIDFVMGGKNCLTYRYIMFTALVAKATDPNIDILSLQASDESAGAYDARSLASKVVFPFQKNMLGNMLNGSNSDPLVNKPGRFPRLSLNNPAAGGDPRKALVLLCADLPKVETADDARKCVDYIVSELLEAKDKRARQLSEFAAVSRDIGLFKTYRFLSDLLDQGFGGAALVLVTTALYNLQFAGDAYEVLAHPVNQPGRSSKQFSDLDLLYDGRPYMGTELKDKPFTSSDVDHAAQTAFEAGALSLMFVAGRQSSFASQPPTYFTKAREKYASNGMYVGLTSVDALMDVVFASHVDMDAGEVFDCVRNTAETIGALEAQMWVYKHATTLSVEFAR